MRNDYFEKSEKEKREKMDEKCIKGTKETKLFDV